MTKHSVSRIDKNHVTYRGFLISTGKNWHHCIISHKLEVQAETRKLMMKAIDSFLAK